MKKNKRILLTFAQETATEYALREETIAGDPFWVVPVVMMVEGVHSGSRGPMLYTQVQLAATTQDWNGIPVTIGHPKNQKGLFISAKLPEVFPNIVGRIYNAKMNGDKLTAECWIDVNALTQVSTEAIEYIKEKKALDVSVGVFSQEEEGEGEWNGEEYRAEAINLTPDHLALLPGEEGACSWDDGCGIRNNSKNKMKVNKKTEERPYPVANFLTTNEDSFGDISRAIQDLVYGMENDKQYYYLEEVYDDHYVYCVVSRNSKDPRKYYKRGYTMNEDGTITPDGDPTQVKKDVRYVAVETTKPVRTNFNTKNKSKMKTNGKPCACTVDSLIQNKATNFTEDDRDWLAGLSQEQLEKLAPKEEEEPAKPVANKKAAEEKPAEKLGVVVAENEDGTISINGKKLSDYIKDSISKETDPAKFIDSFFPGPVANQLKAGLKMHQQRREKLIKEIAANSKFTEEKLKGKTDEDLQDLFESLVGNEDQSGYNYAAAQAGGSLEEEEETEGSDDELTAMLSHSIPAKKEEAAAGAKK
jgi:hypothetical protein